MPREDTRAVSVTIPAPPSLAGKPTPENDIVLMHWLSFQFVAKLYRFVHLNLEHNRKSPTRPISVAQLCFVSCCNQSFESVIGLNTIFLGTKMAKG